MSRRTAYLTEDELKSVGHESECRCATRFEPSRNVPFEAYSYTFVHLDMRKAIGSERTKQRRELVGTMDASYEYLESYRDPGDIFADSDADSRRHLREFAEGIMGTMLGRLLSESSQAPSEHANIDIEIPTAQFVPKKQYCLARIRSSSNLVT
ncbi:MAG: hypothetical protein ABIO72_03435 [Patescibacteria group bacterium]